VAAIALRLRVDRPALGPRAVHSLLVQAARPLPGVAPERQGAGAAVAPGEPRLRLEPPIPAAEPAGGGGFVRVVLSDLSGAAGRYVVALARGGGEVPLGDRIDLPGDGRAVLRLALPDAGNGRLVVRDAATGAEVGSWPVVASRPARTPAGALGEPQVRVESGLAEALVRVGTLRRRDARVEGVRLHGLRLELVPAAGGEPLPVAGAKQEGAWPAGTYRFLLARRLASGLDVPPGAYRLRATATGPDGRRVSAQSRRFALASPP
jgi:hypothetical protein